MTNIDWHTGIPDKDGIYLCKVKGFEFRSYSAMRWSDGYWWSYISSQLFNDRRIEGWISADAQVLEWTLIEELKD